MMMGRGFDHGFEYGLFGCGLLPILLVFLTIGIVIYLISKNQRRRSTVKSQGSQALTILNERLAKGEITTEEYEKIKKVISN